MMSMIMDLVVARLFYGGIHLLSAAVAGAAASVDTVLKVGDVVVAASQAVAHTAGSVGGVVAAAGQGVSDTTGRVVQVVHTASQGVLGGAQDIVTFARLLTGADPVVVPEAIGVTEQQWNLLDQADRAIPLLQDWSDHTFPASSEHFTEKEVSKCLAVARIMAVASALSYAERAQAAARLTRGHWDVQVIDKRDAQAMIFKANTGFEPVMIVAFRGTQLPFDNQVVHKFWPDWTPQFIPDWLRNFDVLLTPYDCEPKENGDCHLTVNGESHPNDNRNLGPQVHNGFWTGWKALRHDLMVQIKDYCSNRHGKVQLYVTGHSQGAALAGVSLLDLLRDQKPETYQIKGCLLLAAPKHGDKDYTIAIADAVAMCNIPLDLVVNYSGIGCDPVVSVPPQFGQFASYAAPAGRLWIVEESRKTMGPATDDKKERVINAHLWEVLGRIIANVPRHAIGGRLGYLHAMEN